MVDQLGGAPEPQYDWQREGGRPGFDFGAVIGRAFSLLARYFLPFAVTAFVIVGIPGIIATVLVLAAMLGSGAVAASAGVGAAVGVVVTIVGAVLLPAAVIYAALRGWTGAPVSMRESVRVMLGRFWSLLGLGILSGLGIALGLVLLVVPGLILLSGWFVAVCALVMERRGVTDSLGRSWDLTRGYKWQILGLIVITFVISMLISAVASIPMLAFGTPDAEAILNGADVPVLGIGFYIGQAFSLIGEAIAQLIGALIAASAYFELRQVREGIAMHSIADVFT